MSKLLSANFTRLKKDKVFWICFGFMVLIGIFIPVNKYMNMKKYNYIQTLDQGFFNYTLLIGVVLSVFCSLFLGTEYNDGTIRNKIVIGHTRTNIYLSNFITCIIADIFLCLAYLVPTLCLGTLLLGFFEADPKLILVFVFGAFVMSFAYAAIDILIAMLNQNKAIVAVLCILSAFLLLFAGVFINARLSSPESYPGYSYLINGEIIEEEEEPNPDYLRGTKRKVYEFFYDFLPGGQAIQFSAMLTEHPKRLILYSSIITILTTGCGLFFFQKKDLK